MMSRGRIDKDITMDSNDVVKSPLQVKQQSSSKSMASIFSSPSSTTSTVNTQRMRNTDEDGGAKGSGSSRDNSRVNHKSSSSSSSNVATTNEVRRSTTTTTTTTTGTKRPFDSADNSPAPSSIMRHRDASSSEASRDQLQQLLGSDISHYHAIRSPDSIHPADDAITPSSHHHHFNRGTALAASVAAHQVTS